MNPSEAAVEPRLPFSRWWPVLAGVLCGVALRLVFSDTTGYPWNAMHGAFIAFAPLAVGAVTVYVAELTQRRTWGYYFRAGMVANVFFVIATMLILIEGLICAILILPLFAIYGGVGGVLMGAICRSSNWPKKKAVYGFAFLPILIAICSPNSDGVPHIGVVERSIVIQADAPKIWAQLHDIRNIQPEEVGHAWMYRIGVPTPESGITRVTSEGLTRDVRMGKNIHFTQHATQWDANRYIRWTYRFNDDSFPPGALDDHVKIGGKYFDLVATEYVLKEIDARSTSLTVRMHYRVSTQFNWYARPLANGLIGNFAEVILGLYARRST
jgi:hypothetical protein